MNRLTKAALAASVCLPLLALATPSLADVYDVTFSGTSTDANSDLSFKGTADLAASGIIQSLGGSFEVGAVTYVVGSGFGNIGPNTFGISFNSANGGVTSALVFGNVTQPTATSYAGSLSGDVVNSGGTHYETGTFLASLASPGGAGGPGSSGGAPAPSLGTGLATLAAGALSLFLFRRRVGRGDLRA